MNTTHTPGPWKDWTNLVVDQNDDPICDVYSRPKDEWLRRSPEADANARLIAAAPQLLKALEDMLEVTSKQAIYKFMDPQRDAARDAITQATLP